MRSVAMTCSGIHSRYTLLAYFNFVAIVVTDFRKPAATADSHERVVNARRKRRRVAAAAWLHRIASTPSEHDPHTQVQTPSLSTPG